MPHRHPQVTPKLTKSPLPTSVMEMLGCTQVLLRASKPGLLRKVLRNLTSSTQPIPKGPENSLWSHKNAREMDVPIKSKVWCNITSKSLQILGGSPSTLVVKPSETLYDSGDQRPNMDSWQKTMGSSMWLGSNNPQKTTKKPLGAPFLLAKITKNREFSHEKWWDLSIVFLLTFTSPQKKQQWLLSHGLP